MKLLKRLKNLWKLSGIIEIKDNDVSFNDVSITVKPSKPKGVLQMAQIISRKDPLEGIIENENTTTRE